MGVTGYLSLAAAGAALVVALAAVAVALRARASQRRMLVLLDRLEGELADLRGRVPAPATAPARLGGLAQSAEVAEFVITDVGARAADPVRVTVADRVVLSATVGEPLVKVAAFGHGLRRALAPESRNRIRFAMRREVRRTRKQRRREMRAAWRRMRAEDGSAA